MFSNTEGMMHRFILFCCAVVLVGCAKPDDQPATETAAAAGEAPVTAGTISLADVAGKWNVRGTPENSDSTVVTYELVATPETSGWKTTFPNRAPIDVRVVSVAGDSIVTESGPFESVLRKGVNVTTRFVARLQDGKLVGTTVARYETTGADSVARFRIVGTRAP